MNCPRCGAPDVPERGACPRCGEPPAEGLTATRRELVEPAADTERPRPTVVGSGASSSDATFSVYGLSETPQGSPGGPPLTGLFAGRYEILAMVGEGGMGRVYKARDRELDKVIALKTIRGEADPDSVQRFKTELLLARKITHKNVVRIHDIGEAEGQKFLTMEFIDGESLKALVRRRSRLPPEESIGVARQVLSALQEAHHQGVVHRDLKPQNIMMDAGGVPHLMDFGIARSLENTGMTATGTIIGTPDYMSPEQVKGERAGPPSDLFSFGVIFYEMLTGDLPYKADTPASRIIMRLSQRPTSPRRLRKEIPKYLEGIVLKCLEVDPAHRYPTAAALVADLDRHHVDRGLTLKFSRAVRRQRWPLAVAAAAALAYVGLGVWWARRPGPPPAPEAVHTVAILPITNASGSSELEWLRAGLPEMLVTDLAQSRYVRAVPGERVARLLQEAGLGQQSRFDEAALETVGRLSHAQSVLSGQFVESGGRLRLDLNLRRAGSGVPTPVKVEGAATDVFGLVDQITGRIKESLDLSPAQLRADQDRPLAEMGTASLPALRAYQAGLAELRRGAHQAALPFLKEATAQDPAFALAHARLAQAAAAA
ncbi:MAG TPA: serine/threonine-protein kinase, partial [Vicinamibacteria bacterium]